MATACARHILVKTERKALELKAKIAKGADFSQLTKKIQRARQPKKTET